MGTQQKGLGEKNSSEVGKPGGKQFDKSPREREHPQEEFGQENSVLQRGQENRGLQNSKGTSDQEILIKLRKSSFPLVVRLADKLYGAEKQVGRKEMEAKTIHALLWEPGSEKKEEELVGRWVGR